MRIFVRAYIIIFILAVCVLRCFAQEESLDYAKQLFYKANSLYEKSKFEEAIAEYEKIIKSSSESGEVYYNLGNSYIKRGCLGKAILNYERAKKLMPLDRDLQANLKYACSLIKNDIFNRPRFQFLEFPNKLLEVFTIDGLTLILFTIYLVFILLLTGNIFLKRLRKSFFYTIAVVFLAGFLLLTVKIYQVRYTESAVVIFEEIEAKFEPFDDAASHFKLYEGFKVYVLKQEDKWLKIKRGDGKIGWIKSESCEII